ncbi:uncharacterized protein CC84DRAFT_1166954 [Paraphaeosphaeria sporulosa]|uniref:Uncharacterized protein n=1 Tax=Paraphaeosphaeria sporulosa TaxID=1460663 RepID=A0A177C8Y3_9PLEO|nr:uncharacterized protein CC84DRAFT_1166954 [Paraphaeosphaeria sporulosa]OAG03217.1 hypothetical protein CC84DRAFT_1166954 [Paraphaeosphaeria sporulosa]
MLRMLRVRLVVRRWQALLGVGMMHVARRASEGAACRGCSMQRSREETLAWSTDWRRARAQSWPCPVREAGAAATRDAARGAVRREGGWRPGWKGDGTRGNSPFSARRLEPALPYTSA